MVIAITPQRRVAYVLESERPRKGQVDPPVPTVFYLRDLTPSEDAEVSDSGGVMRDGVFVPQTSTQQLRALRKGLVGWENLYDEKGNVIEFDPDAKGEAFDAQLGLLPRAVRRELGREILRGLTVDTAEKS